MVKKTLALAAMVVLALVLSTPAFAQCSAYFQVGSEVTLTATACPGFSFSHWEGVKCKQGQKTKKCTYTVPENNITITPKYVVAPHWKRTAGTTESQFCREVRALHEAKDLLKTKSLKKEM